MTLKQFYGEGFLVWCVYQTLYLEPLKKMTVGELAKMAGVSKPTVKKWIANIDKSIISSEPAIIHGKQSEVFFMTSERLENCQAQDTNWARLAKSYFVIYRNYYHKQTSKIYSGGF